MSSYQCCPSCVAGSTCEKPTWSGVHDDHCDVTEMAELLTALSASHTAETSLVLALLEKWEAAQAERDSARAELAAFKSAVAERLRFEMSSVVTGTPEQRLTAELAACRAERDAAVADCNEWRTPPGTKPPIAGYDPGNATFLYALITVCTSQSEQSGLLAWQNGLDVSGFSFVEHPSGEIIHCSQPSGLLERESCQIIQVLAISTILARRNQTTPSKRLADIGKMTAVKHAF